MSKGRQSLSKCNPKAESDLLRGRGNTLDNGCSGWVHRPALGLKVMETK